MRRDELIIDGTSVDLADAKIALTYTNNILGDISKISASHSYTITLPLTTLNERVFDYPTSVSHESSKIGKYLDAEYRRNGITIVRGAKAYVTQVGEDGIQICLLWDGLAKLSKWLKEEHTLNELTFEETVWDGVSSDYYDRFNLVVQADYETGVPSTTLPPTPSVNLDELLSWVMNESLGMDYTIEVPGMRNELRELFLPLCSRGGTRSPNRGGTYTNLGSGYLVNGKHYYSYLRRSGALVFDNDECDVSEFDKVILTFNLSARTAQLTSETYGMRMEVYTVGTPSVNFATFQAVRSGDTWSIVDEVTVDTTNVSTLRVTLRGLKDNAPQGQRVNGGFTLVPYVKEAHLNDPYDAGQNLPATKMVDFIKTICTLFGAQVVNTKDGRLSFVSVDTLYQNKGKALDWTDKVVNYKRVPKSAKFGVGSFAQTNWLRYSKDDKVEIDADGAFYVENETLDREKDAATVFFAPSDERTIVQYEQDDKGNVKDVKVTPRIMRAYNNDGTLGLEFAQSLYMSSIITRWYGGLRRLLEYPVELTVYARLDERDLANLDWTIPVYLRQTGKYYIAKEVKTDSDGEISELTLIQL